MIVKFVWRRKVRNKSFLKYYISFYCTNSKPETGILCKNRIGENNDATGWYQYRENNSDQFEQIYIAPVQALYIVQTEKGSRMVITNQV